MFTIENWKKTEKHLENKMIPLPEMTVFDILGMSFLSFIFHI